MELSAALAGSVKYFSDREAELTDREAALPHARTLSARGEEVRRDGEMLRTLLEKEAARLADGAQERLDAAADEKVERLETACAALRSQCVHVKAAAKKPVMREKWTQSDADESCAPPARAALQPAPSQPCTHAAVSRSVKGLPRSSRTPPPPPPLPQQQPQAPAQAQPQAQPQALREAQQQVGRARDLVGWLLLELEGTTPSELAEPERTDGVLAEGAPAGAVGGVQAANASAVGSRRGEGYVSLAELEACRRRALPAAAEMILVPRKVRRHQP